MWVVSGWLALELVGAVVVGAVALWRWKFGNRNVIKVDREVLQGLVDDAAHMTSLVERYLALYGPLPPREGAGDEPRERS